MISKDQVVHIAKLARLELSDSEILRMQKDLSAILDYFALLKKAPVATIKQKHAATKVTANRVRKDEVLEKPASLANNLVQQAPDKKDGYLKVKAVL